MFSVAVFCFDQVVFATPRGSVMLDCGFSPLMSSLSDRNRRLGDVLLPPEIKQWYLYPWVQGLFTLRKVILMQLSVALSLHFGWDSQLNTSELFWIDISRWMICSRCRWISVYLPWCTAHAFEPLPFFCSIVSIAVRFQSCRLPNCDFFTSHRFFIVFWERYITSERHGTPVHISTTIYTLSLLSVFTFCCSHHYHYLLRLILCKQQGRRD